jgi:tRNA(Ile)-lysidine synthase TilS/MesJ
LTAADTALPLSDDEAFSVFQAYVTRPRIALALSGGPDSMALGFMLSRYAAARVIIRLFMH